MSEAASAPLPEQLANRGADPLGDSAFQQSTVTEVPRNGGHIPSFYKHHADPASTVVKQSGVPLSSMAALQFTVAEVAPERRWAIAENGEVLPQHIFQDRLVNVREEYFQEVVHIKPPGDLAKEAIPQVTKYVSMTVDPVDKTKLVPIGFDPNRKPNADGERTLWDSKGEEYVTGDDAMRLLVDAYHSPKFRKTLKAHEVEEVEAYIKSTGGIPVQDSSGLVTQLEQLNAMLSDGDITQEVHSKRVAALTGTSATEADEPKARPGYMLASCGEEIPRAHSKKHKAECGECGEPEAA